MSIRETVTDTVTDTIKNLEAWSLDAIKSSEGKVLSATKNVTDSLEPLTDRVPTAAILDVLPEPKKVVTNWFDYLEKVLAQQKHFSVELASTLVRTHTPASRPAAKPRATRRKAAAA